MRLMSKRPLGKHYIAEWIKYRKASLRKLAARMESEPGVQLISHASIGRIAKGDQPYSEEILIALADALDCSVAQLLMVNPFKDGEVIDMLSLMKDKDPATVRAILSGLPSIKAKRAG